VARQGAWLRQEYRTILLFSTITDHYTLNQLYIVVIGLIFKLRPTQ